MQPPTKSGVFDDPLIGAMLGGKYVIEYRIALGGSGAVYRAIQQPIRRAVAVKVMRPDLNDIEQATFEERFLVEASQLGSLQHPNVVTVHDFGRTADGACFIVMELLEGETLKAALKHGPLSLEMGLDIALQLTRGLRHAHRAGMIHRDIKAGNAMLIPDGDGKFRAKLLDFGLVKFDGEASITGEGLFMGTPHYVSPEQARGMSADFRSDIYSLGVLMYRIFTGRLPYYSRNPMAIAIAHIQEPFPSMARRAPEVDVPSQIEAVVRKCMAKDPAERFPDAESLFVTLNELRTQLTPGLSPVETVSLPLQQTSKRSAWSMPLLVGAGLAAVGLMGVVAVGLLAVLPLSGAPEPVAVVAPAPAVEAAPEPVPEPDPVREVPLLISSEPAGAEVLLEGLSIGTTPYAGKLRLEPDEALIQALRLELAGYRSAEADIDLSGETAAHHAVLQVIPKPKPKATPPPPPSEPDVYADGVVFSAAEAAAAVQFINTADESALRSAGIASRQVNIILKERPFSGIQAFAETHFIGEKTVLAARHAAR